MPMYEYQCNNCGEAFEQIVRFSEADLLPVCPACGARETRKKISVAAFIGAPSPSLSVGSSSCGSGGRFS